LFTQGQAFHTPAAFVSTVSDARCRIGAVSYGLKTRREKLAPRHELRRRNVRPQVRALQCAIAARRTTRRQDTPGSTLFGLSPGAHARFCSRTICTRHAPASNASSSKVPHAVRFTIALSIEHLQHALSSLPPVSANAALRCLSGPSSTHLHRSSHHIPPSGKPSFIF